MKEEQTAIVKKWKMGGGAVVFAIIALPLYREFSSAGETGWNIILVAFLMAMAVAGIFLNRYFSAHPDQVGEARFDTGNKGERDG